MQDMLSESPRCNDMVADLHFPRLEVFRHSHSMWNSAAFSEKRSESRSQRSMQKYQYFEWGSTLNLDGFKIIIFQYVICEPFRSWKEGLAKLDVNLWEIWRKFKCRRSMSYPPGYMIKIRNFCKSHFWEGKKKKKKKKKKRSIGWAKYLYVLRLKYQR